MTLEWIADRLCMGAATHVASLLQRHNQKGPASEETLFWQTCLLSLDRPLDPARAHASLRGDTGQESCPGRQSHFVSPDPRGCVGFGPLPIQAREKRPSRSIPPRHPRISGANGDLAVLRALCP